MIRPPPRMPVWTPIYVSPSLQTPCQPSTTPDRPSPTEFFIPPTTATIVANTPPMRGADCPPPLPILSVNCARYDQWALTTLETAELLRRQLVAVVGGQRGGRGRGEEG